MTPPSHRRPCVCEAIPDLLERLHAAGESASWDDFRQDIKHLLRDRSLAAPERILLLEVYDELVTRVEQRCAGEPEALAKVGYQRAMDCMVFTLSESGFFDGDRDARAFDRTLYRERALGRFRHDDHVRQAASDIVAMFSTADREPHPPQAAR